MALQRLPHEGKSRRFVALFDDIAFKDFAFVIDGAPQVYHLAAELYVHLVEVPAASAGTHASG
jgi:hypothetical protein